MKPLDIVRNSLKYADPIIHALQIIQSMTGLGGGDAATLRVVDAVVHTLNDGIGKGLDPRKIVEELDRLVAGIAANDAKHDRDLVEKFRGD